MLPADYVQFLWLANYGTNFQRLLLEKADRNVRAVFARKGQRSFAIGSVDRRKSLLFVLLNAKDFTTHFDCLLLVLLLVSFV